MAKAHKQRPKTRLKHLEPGDHVLLKSGMLCTMTRAHDNPNFVGLTVIGERSESGEMFVVSYRQTVSRSDTPIKLNKDGIYRVKEKM